MPNLGNNLFDHLFSRNAVWTIVFLASLYLGACTESADNPELITQSLPQLAAPLDAANSLTVAEHTALQLRFLTMFDDFRLLQRRGVGNSSVGFGNTDNPGQFSAVFLPEACPQGGTATLSGTDADYSNDVSQGDTIIITFSNCDDELYSSLSGTFEHTIVYDLYVADEVINIEFYDAFDEQRRRSSLVTSYTIDDWQANSADGFTYTWSESKSQYLEYYVAGVEPGRAELLLDYTFGCGHVSAIWGGEMPNTKILGIAGVSNVKDVGVFFLSNPEGLQFDRSNNSDYPFAGVLSYESGSSQPCQGAGIGANVEGDGSAASLAVLGSGNALITGHSADGSYFELTTTWP